MVTLTTTTTKDKEELDVNSSCMMADNLTCGVCLCDYDSVTHTPLLLPACGHTFCSVCIDQLYTQNKWACPQCRKSNAVQSPHRQSGVSWGESSGVFGAPLGVSSGESSGVPWGVSSGVSDSSCVLCVSSGELCVLCAPSGVPSGVFSGVSARPPLSLWDFNNNNNNNTPCINNNNNTPPGMNKNRNHCKKNWIFKWPFTSRSVRTRHIGMMNTQVTQVCVGNTRVNKTSTQYSIIHTHTPRIEVEVR
ncbi:hypothetical protein Pmani_006928 [Petrolisthes manimaculis]|uniref:RING-type domain-containing protein n=1 Tax=Petrolisthes manimaculis TaxID=1843537 RepID=A0AAE1UG33_9EUCA|nr:hypothetical protein Pmani_006928 [Petrolisthes manimaculis]